MSFHRMREPRFPRTGDVWSDEAPDPEVFFGEPDRSREGAGRCCSCASRWSGRPRDAASECQSDVLVGASGRGRGARAGLRRVSWSRWPWRTAGRRTGDRGEAGASAGGSGLPGRGGAEHPPEAGPGDRVRRAAGRGGGAWVRRHGALMRRWVDGPLPRDVEAALERLARGDDVRRIAVMPDVHLSADVCIGTVVATGGTLYPNAVGGDIGCGVAALPSTARPRWSTGTPPPRSSRACTAPSRWPATAARAASRCRLASRRAPLSAPSLEAHEDEGGRPPGRHAGAGNHFVELQADEAGRLWLMLHSGSRGIGQAIRDHHLARCGPGATGCASCPPTAPRGAPTSTTCSGPSTTPRPAGSRWCERRPGGRRTRARDRGRRGVLRLLPPQPRAPRNPRGEDLWVHRKGAMSAAAVEPGLIPGSMGTQLPRGGPWLRGGALVERARGGPAA